MNLSPLSAKHGYPVSYIIPGLYGMMNPKWITEIERVDSVYEGYWKRNGWSNMDDVKTGFSLVIPGQASIRERFRKLDDTRTEETDKACTYCRIAFAGDRGISRVEVSRKWRNYLEIS